MDTHKQGGDYPSNFTVPDTHRIDASGEPTADLPDGDLHLSGRVFATRQMNQVCGRDNLYRRDFAPYESPSLRTGDLRLSARLDPAALTAYIAMRHEREYCGRLTATIYDGLCWRRFDLASLQIESEYPNPAMLEKLVADTRAAVARHAGSLCRAITANGETSIHLC